MLESESEIIAPYSHASNILAMTRHTRAIKYFSVHVIYTTKYRLCIHAQLGSFLRVHYILDDQK